MDYNEIKTVVETYPYYSFPIQADDSDGHRIVIIEGHEIALIDNQQRLSHFYKVFTYLENNVVRINTYYDYGAEVETYQ